MDSFSFALTVHLALLGFEGPAQLEGADMSIMARQTNGNKLGGVYVTCLQRTIRKLTEELNPSASSASQSEISTLAGLINKEKPKKPDVSCLTHALH